MKGGEKMHVLTALARMAPELLACASVMVIFYIYRKDTKEKEQADRDTTANFTEALTKFNDTLEDMTINITTLNQKIENISNDVDDIKRHIENEQEVK